MSLGHHRSGQLNSDDERGDRESDSRRGSDNKSSQRLLPTGTFLSYAWKADIKELALTSLDISNGDVLRLRRSEGSLVTGSPSQANSDIYTKETGRHYIKAELTSSRETIALTTTTADSPTLRSASLASSSYQDDISSFAAIAERRAGGTSINDDGDGGLFENGCAKTAVDMPSNYDDVDDGRDDGDDFELMLTYEDSGAERGAASDGGINYRQRDATAASTGVKNGSVNMGDPLRGSSCRGRRRRDRLYRSQPKLDSTSDHWVDTAGTPSTLCCSGDEEGETEEVWRTIDAESLSGDQGSSVASIYADGFAMSAWTSQQQQFAEPQCLEASQQQYREECQLDILIGCEPKPFETRNSVIDLVESRAALPTGLWFPPSEQYEIQADFTNAAEYSAVQWQTNDGTNFQVTTSASLPDSYASAAGGQSAPADAKVNVTEGYPLSIGYFAISQPSSMMLPHQHQVHYCDVGSMTLQQAQSSTMDADSLAAAAGLTAGPYDQRGLWISDDGTAQGGPSSHLGTVGSKPISGQQRPLYNRGAYELSSPVDEWGSGSVPLPVYSGNPAEGPFCNSQPPTEGMAAMPQSVEAQGWSVVGGSLFGYPLRGEGTGTSGGLSSIEYGIQRGGTGQVAQQEIQGPRQQRDGQPPLYSQRSGFVAGPVGKQTRQNAQMGDIVPPQDYNTQRNAAPKQGCEPALPPVTMEPENHRSRQSMRREKLCPPGRTRNSPDTHCAASLLPVGRRAAEDRQSASPPNSESMKELKRRQHQMQRRLQKQLEQLEQLRQQQHQQQKLLLEQQSLQLQQQKRLVEIEITKQGSSTKMATEWPHLVTPRGYPSAKAQSQEVARGSISQARKHPDLPTLGTAAGECGSRETSPPSRLKVLQAERRGPASAASTLGAERPPKPDSEETNKLTSLSSPDACRSVHTKSPRGTAVAHAAAVDRKVPSSLARHQADRRNRVEPQTATRPPALGPNGIQARAIKDFVRSYYTSLTKAAAVICSVGTVIDERQRHSLEQHPDFIRFKELHDESPTLSLGLKTRFKELDVPEEASALPVVESATKWCKIPGCTIRSLERRLQFLAICPVAFYPTSGNFKVSAPSNSTDQLDTAYTVSLTGLMNVQPIVEKGRMSVVNRLESHFSDQAVSISTPTATKRMGFSHSFVLKSSHHLTITDESFLLRPSYDISSNGGGRIKQRTLEASLSQGETDGRDIAGCRVTPQRLLTTQDIPKEQPNDVTDMSRSSMSLGSTATQLMLKGGPSRLRHRSHIPKPTLNEPTTMAQASSNDATNGHVEDGVRGRGGRLTDTSQQAGTQTADLAQQLELELQLELQLEQRLEQQSLSEPLNSPLCQRNEVFLVKNKSRTASSLQDHLKRSIGVVYQPDEAGQKIVDAKASSSVAPSDRSDYFDICKDSNPKSTAGGDRLVRSERTDTVELSTSLLNDARGMSKNPPLHQEKKELALREASKRLQLSGVLKRSRPCQFNIEATQRIGQGTQLSNESPSLRTALNRTNTADSSDLARGQLQRGANRQLQGGATTTSASDKYPAVGTPATADDFLSSTSLSSRVHPEGDAAQMREGFASPQKEGSKIIGDGCRSPHNRTGTAAAVPDKIINDERDSTGTLKGSTVVRTEGIPAASLEASPEQAAWWESFGAELFATIQGYRLSFTRFLTLRWLLEAFRYRYFANARPALSKSTKKLGVGCRRIQARHQEQEQQNISTFCWLLDWMSCQTKISNARGRRARDMPAESLHWRTVASRTVTKLVKFGTNNAYPDLECQCQGLRARISSLVLSPLAAYLTFFFALCLAVLVILVNLDSNFSE